MDETTKMALIGAAALLVGVLGWVLPYKYNILKLKHSIAKNFSEATNIKIARGIGTVLILVGAVLLTAVAMGVKIEQ
jgi:hypothetical protein